jgi:FkbM family methyltransferase
MRLLKVVTIFKKSAGDARWSSYPTWAEKLQVFKALFYLRYRTEIAPVNLPFVSLTVFGFRITGLSYSELLYLFREIFLHGEYSRFTSTKKDPSILDCGANIGMAILYFKKRFPHCRVLAFEPNPKVFECLRKNISDNELTGVELVHAGLSDEESLEPIYVDSRNSLISSIDPNRGGKDSIVVNFVKLSSAIDKRKFDFAKIDVEGSEEMVARDLHVHNVVQNIDQYFFEYHHNIQNSEQRLSDFLKIFESHNYQYNLMSSYSRPGDFQDIRIHFYQSHKLA